VKNKKEKIKKNKEGNGERSLRASCADLGFLCSRWYTANNSILFIFLFSLFICSCCGPFGAKNSTVDNPPPGMGTFSLALSSPRTIRPTTPALNHFNKLELRFLAEGGGAASHNEIIDPYNGVSQLPSVYLKPGDYSLTVNAYKGTALAARGTLDPIISITEGQLTSDTVTLKTLLTEGTGTFSWDITVVPTPVTSATMTITPLRGGGTEVPEAPLTITGTRAIGSRTLNSGPYNVTFTFTAGGQQLAWYEYVHVYSTLDSKFTKEFTLAYFNSTNYTVTFKHNDNDVTGDGTQSVQHGGTIPNFLPERTAEAYLHSGTPTTTSGFDFDGWYTDSNTLWNPGMPVIGATTLNAGWTGAIDVFGQTGDNDVERAIEYVKNHVGAHTLFVCAGASIDTGPQTINTADFDLTIQGHNGRGIIQLSGSGSLFTISDSTASLTLGKNITLQGVSGSTSSLVSVSNGTFTMKDGSKITGHETGATGTVSVSAVFIMEGGEVSGNTANVGGGVAVGYGGNFIMSGTARVADNTASGSIGGYGGGVYLTYNGKFTMSDSAEVSGNKASEYGGGVCMSGSNGGIFTMNGGSVLNNEAGSGGGVYVNSGNTFTMTGGTISGNKAVGDGSGNGGGGVYAFGDTFSMSGGIITNNTDTFGTNTANPADIFVYPDSSEISGITKITLSSTAQVGTVTLDMFEEWANYHFTLISIASGWGGSIGSLNLRHDFPTDFTSSSWIGREIIAGAGGYALTTADIARITLGQFRNNTPTDFQPINNTHVFGELSPNIGMLAAVTLTNTFTVNDTAGWITALSDIRDGGDNKSYRINILSNMAVGGITTSNVDTGLGTVAGLTVTLRGIGNAKLYLNSPGSILRVNANQTLIIDSANLTLQGLRSGENGATQNNNTAVVYVNGNNAKLELRNGTITGNTNTSIPGGGVYVSSGTFTMSGGTISNNTGTAGGSGVRVADSGTFTMSEGTINGNVGGTNGVLGGGVSVASGSTFTMSGGTISNNTVYGGGGVSLDGSGVSPVTFTMNGGKISGNNASGNGGGVYLEKDVSTFTMNGGEISGNTSNYCGGVFISEGTFTMNGGEISDNTASNYGGGVLISNGTFAMNGGEISGNTASSGSGGGVDITSGTFTMYGGKIYDNNANGTGSTNGGGGVYVAGTFTMYSGKIYGNEAYSGGGVYATTDGTFTMDGGEIYGNTTTYYGGGVSVSSGTFTMDGGEIYSNKTDFSGGGVYLYDADSEFFMNGGEIYGNNANYGGGVYADGLSSSLSIFTMNNGEISGNTAATQGGGVYLYTYATFTMNNGKISGNTAGAGGGVYVNSSNSTFNMSGGSITGNKITVTTANGGGVYTSGTFRVGGTAIISGNARSTNTITNNANNAYMASSAYITLGDNTPATDNVPPPASGMNIHAATERTDGIIVQSVAISGQEAFFTADESGKQIMLEGDQIKIQ